jgi:adenylate kinase family enzyme
MSLKSYLEIISPKDWKKKYKKEVLFDTKEYKEKTEPLIEFYNKSRKLITIKADSGKEEVLKKAVRKIGAKKIKI